MCPSIPKTIFLLPLLILLAVSVRANPAFRHYDVRDGIADNYIKSLSIDRLGRLWIVSDGIDTFDGHTFHRLATDPGLKPSAIVFGADGSVWAKGISCIAVLEENLFSDASARLATMGIHREINDICADTDGNLYLISSDSIFMYATSGDFLTGTSLKGIRPVGVTAARQVKGTIYITDGDGNVYELRFPEGTVRKCAVLPVRHSHIMATPDGDLLLYGTPGHGMVRVNPDSGHYDTMTGCTPYLVTSAAVGPDGMIVAGTNHDGLIVMDKSGLPTVQYVHDRDNPFSPGSNHITSVLTDGDIIIAGTGKSGIGIASLSSPAIERHDITADEDISVIRRSPEGRILMGTDGKGLVELTDIHSGTTAKVLDTNNSPLRSAAVIGIAESPSGLLLGTYGGGIYLYRAGMIAPVAGLSDSLDYVRHILAMPDGRLWAGTFDKGLHAVGSRSFTRTNSVLRSDCVTGLAAASDTLLVATSSGLYMVEPGSTVPARIPDRKWLDDVTVNALFRDSRGLTWIGNKEGIYVLDGTFATLSRLTAGDGMSDNTVRAIAEDTRGDIWITGDNGMTRVRPIMSDSGYTFVIHALYAADGLGDITFNRYALTCLDDGSIVAGGLGKYVVIHPQGAGIRPAKEKVWMSAVTLGDNECIPAGPMGESSLEIPHDKPLTVEFSSFDLVNRERTKYEYSLDDSSWTPMADNRCSFDGGLTPGTHTLKVRLHGSAGMTEISIRVIPPWWRSYIAIAAYIIAAICIIGALWYIYVSREKRRLRRQMIEKTLLRQENAPLSHDEEFLAKIRKVIDDNLDDETFSVERLSDIMSMSRSNLYKKLQGITGKTPVEFIRLIRIREGKRLLDSEGGQISQTAYRVGISPKQFARYFKEEYGVLPSEYITSRTK